MPLLVAILVIVGDVFVLVLEGAPAVEIVPEVVEVLDLLFRALLITKLGYRLYFAKATFGNEDWTP